MDAIAMPRDKHDHEPRPIEELEDEITALSAVIQAATHRLLGLIEEMDRRGGWADPLGASYRSMAHWLSHRVGMNLGAARQYVRVARALPGLPLISAAFSKGELSYSKVRALTRIADQANEEMLLGWAQAGTASHVETLVRRYRRASRIYENERAEAREAARGLRTWFDADGMLVVEGRLTPEQGALFTKALDRASDALYSPPEVSAETRGEEGPGNEVVHAVQDESSHSMRLADALALVAERSLAAEATEQGGGDRFQVVVHVDQEVLADPDADGRSELEEGPAISPDTVRRLGCDGAVSIMRHTEVGELRPGRKSRVISTPLRRALRARDGTRCAFPGCTCRARDAHHVRHWADGGPTVLENLVGLCRRHHTLVHEGRCRVDVRPEGGYRFLDPRGRELLPAPPLPAVGCDPVAELGARWLGPDAERDPRRGVPSWDGESFDYDWAVESLQDRAGMV